MSLNLIGLGLCDYKDLSYRSIEAIKESEIVYLENYTSFMRCTKEELEKFLGKKVILADRHQSENLDSEIVNLAKTKNVSFIIIGDPLSATTHIDLVNLAKKENVPCQIMNNASVFTAISRTGLQLYKFGKVTSIPFPERCPNLETPYRILEQNLEIGAHTLFLLDLHPSENRNMTVKEAVNILMKIQEKTGENIINEKTKFIACSQLGWPEEKIVTFTVPGNVPEITQAPQCLIIPGKLHFVEEDLINTFR